MKYKCGMIKDIMPLCIDEEASESSKNAVIEHISECKECEKYYTVLSRDIAVDNEDTKVNDGFSTLAAKLRRRKLVTRIIIALIIFIMFELMLNYSLGYRFTPERAANTSGRLNFTSELMTSYDWGDWQFYFYESYSSYDVVSVQKTWHGWRVSESSLTWPKLYQYNDIEVAGALYFWTDKNDKYGIQIFPMKVSDPNVASLEMTVFGETKKAQVTMEEITLLTFDNSNPKLGNNDASGYAYNKEGEVLYKLETLEVIGKWVWMPVGN